MENLPYANEDDIIRCIAIVKQELSNANLDIDNLVLRKITLDIMGISYAKGGGYSNYTIRKFAEVYIKQELYKSLI